ncbi:MAG TPA: hypothetical protein DEF78_11795 [Sphingobacterium sp.]|nr:hypothetical protein [Sphingobacterium sp.]
MDKLFRQVSVKDRLPDLFKTTIFIDRLGNANQLSIDRKNEVYDRKTRNWITETDLLISYDYWLEPVELPTEDEILEYARDEQGLEDYDMEQDVFVDGANYILNTLKGEKR